MTMTTWRLRARSISHAVVTLPLVAALGAILDHARRW
jgi:hypothetical protein